MLHKDPHKAPAHWFGEAILNFRASAHADPLGPIGARQQNAHNARVKEYLDRLWSEAFISGAAYRASIEPVQRFMIVTQEEKDAFAETIRRNEEDALRDAMNTAAAEVTEEILRPALEAAGVDNPGGYSVAFDETPVLTRAPEPETPPVVPAPPGEIDRLRERVALLEGAIDGAATDLLAFPKSMENPQLDAWNIATVLRIIKDRK